MNDQDYPPLKDLVQTYLPNEDMRKISVDLEAVKCATCGYVTYFIANQPDRLCPYCARKDKFL